MDPILIIILIGAVAGMVKSFLGYVPNPEGFNVMRFIQTIILAALTGAAVVFGTKIYGQPEPILLSVVDYIEAFLMSAGTASYTSSVFKAGGKKLT